MKIEYFLLALLSLNSFSLENDKIKMPDNRWTVCSMTLNSKDEIKTFKKRLSNKSFKFVELLDFNPKDNEREEQGFNSEAWFDKACESKEIKRCDMIVISGHFTPYAREFYGEEQDLTLSLENLLRHRCSKSCENILGGQPTEVFLFGCNTLNASCETTMTEKQKEENILRFMKVRGFSREDAEMMVEALAFSSIRSVRDEMKDVFEGSPSIHGFNGTGPIGAVIRPYLDDALKEILKNSGGDYMNHLEKIITNNSISGADADYIDKTFFRHLYTNFKQDIGHSNYSFCTGRENVITEESEKLAKIKESLCRILNEMIPLNERLKFVKSLTTGDSFFHYLPFIAKFFKYNTQFDSEGQKIIEEIKKNDVLKTQLLDFIDAMTSGSVLIDAISLSETLEWLSHEEANQKRKEAIFNVLNLERITSQDKDLICSMAKSGKLGKIEDMKIEVTSERLKHLDYEEGIQLFSCLKLKGEGVVTRLKANIKNKKDLPIIKLSMNYIFQLDSSREDLIEMLTHLKSLKKRDVNEYILETLSNHGRLQDKINSEEFIADFLHDKEFFWDALEILSKLPHLDKNTITIFEKNIVRAIELRLRKKEKFPSWILSDLSYDFYRNDELRKEIIAILNRQYPSLNFHHIDVAFAMRIGMPANDLIKHIPLKFTRQYWAALSTDNDYISLETRLNYLKSFFAISKNKQELLNLFIYVFAFHNQTSLRVFDSLLDLAKQHKLKVNAEPAWNVDLYNDHQFRDMALVFIDDQALNNRVLGEVMNNKTISIDAKVNLIRQIANSETNLFMNKENMKRVTDFILKNMGFKMGTRNGSKPVDSTITEFVSMYELINTVNLTNAIIKDGGFVEKVNHRSLKNKGEFLEYLLFEEKYDGLYIEKFVDLFASLLGNFSNRSDESLEKILGVFHSPALQDEERRERVLPALFQKIVESKNWQTHLKSLKQSLTPSDFEILFVQEDRFCSNVPVDICHDFKKDFLN